MRMVGAYIFGLGAALIVGLGTVVYLGQLLERAAATFSLH